MTKHIAALFSGVGLSVLIALGAFGVRKRGEIARNVQRVAQRGSDRGRRLVRRSQRFAEGLRQPGIDLNTASTDELMSLGVDREVAERIVENRPYRSRLDLVSRMVVVGNEYNRIKHQVSVSRPDQVVKIAS